MGKITSTCIAYVVETTIVFNYQIQPLLNETFNVEHLTQSHKWRMCYEIKLT